MNRPELIYVGDPMCSWCFGFAPVMRALHESFIDRLDMRIVVGGLRTGPDQIVDEDRIQFLRTHWQQVSQRTRQRFNTDILASTGWLYDTELACRAVVAMRRLQPGVVFEYFERVQTNFYQGNQDPARVETYAAAAERFDVTPATFRDCYEDPVTIAETARDFMWASRIGVRGFPAVLLYDGEQYAALTLGYQDQLPLVSALEGWLAESSRTSTS
ncbi:MAG: DsbA family protein [Pseudomonadota bacterium]